MIAIGCDHAALDLKMQIISYLQKKGESVKDFGTFTNESCDYTDFARLCALSVASGESSLGILVCGTGIGMSIAANKIRGIRCAHCCDEFSAKATREHNNANMLAIGARITLPEIALKIVDAFIYTPFSFDQRHIKRINKITDIENEFF